tara:strand:- start:144 stop:707 length:564 start_codon:yes stop_codon:yes gene_type:complete
MEKLIVISAPSGAGKSTIVNYLLKNINSLSFSISACSRPKRKGEIEGEDYYFISLGQFKNKIRNNEFLEWEEVYPNHFYGTLMTEIKKIWGEKKTVIFDIDVVGGLNIKNKFLKDCLSIFIMPPSLSALEKRLKLRGTESNEKLSMRLEKAKKEIKKSEMFDQIIVNDSLDEACLDAKRLVLDFIKK